jgi:CheY-like chemotaxis protein
MLTDAGAVVHLAENGVVALQQVGRLWPGQLDLVLMDVHMPVMDGLQAASALRQTCPELPVLALTAHALPEQRARSADTGMRAHLSKPVEQDTLIATVLSHLPGPGGAAAAPRPARRPPQAGMPWPADAVPGIDLEQALGRCAGKADLLLDLLKRFADDQAEVASDIAAARQQDSAALGPLVHRLKGVAANMTMDDLHDCTEAVEDLLEQGVTGPALSLALDDLIGCVQGLCARLRAWLPDAADAAAFSPGPR